MSTAVDTTLDFAGASCGSVGTPGVAVTITVSGETEVTSSVSVDTKSGPAPMSLADVVMVIKDV